MRHPRRDHGISLINLEDVNCTTTKPDGKLPPVSQDLNLVAINISVILISGGDGDVGARTSVELFHTNGSRLCSLPDLPYNRSSHSQTGLTACGGSGSAAANTTCHTLTNIGSWIQSHNLDQDRRAHSAWTSPQGVLLIGGVGSSAQTTSEILLDNGETAPGFNLDDST